MYCINTLSNETKIYAHRSCERLLGGGRTTELKLELHKDADGLASCSKSEQIKRCERINTNLRDLITFSEGKRDELKKQSVRLEGQFKQLAAGQASIRNSRNNLVKSGGAGLFPGMPAGLAGLVRKIDSVMKQVGGWITQIENNIAILKKIDSSCRIYQGDVEVIRICIDEGVLTADLVSTWDGQVSAIKDVESQDEKK